MKNTLKIYIRDEQRNPKGVAVIVRKKNGQKLFGYSLCCPKDKFDKKIGTEMAVLRAKERKLKADTALAPLVSERREKICSAYIRLEEMGQKYFKQDNN
jgi:hypothetical protein